MRKTLETNYQIYEQNGRYVARFAVYGMLHTGFFCGSSRLCRDPYQALAEVFAAMRAEAAFEMKGVSS